MFSRLALQEAFKVTSITVLDNHIAAALGLEELVEMHDIGMIDLVHDVDLCIEQTFQNVIGV